MLWSLTGPVVVGTTPDRTRYKHVAFNLGLTRESVLGPTPVHQDPKGNTTTTATAMMHLFHCCHLGIWPEN